MEKQDPLKGFSVICRHELKEYRDRNAVSLVDSWRDESEAAFDMPERKAEVILKIAQAIGNQLGLAELLASLNETLNPDRPFRRDRHRHTRGDAVTVHCAHFCELKPSAGESVERVVGRYASSIKVEPPPMKLPCKRPPD